MWHAAILVLIRCNILQPLGEEIRNVHIERRGRRKGLCVAGPAKPFVALRTVSRHVDEVAFLSPDDVVLELIDEGL